MRLFRFLDVDRSGGLSKAQFRMLPCVIPESAATSLLQALQSVRWHITAASTTRRQRMHCSSGTRFAHHSHHDCPSFGERIGCRYDVNHSGQLSYIEFVRGIYAQEKAWGIRSEETERQVVPSSVAHDLIDCNAVSSRSGVAMRRAAALGSRCGA